MITAQDCIKWVNDFTWEAYPESVGVDLYEWFLERKLTVACNAKTCLNNKDGWCNVRGQIDLDANGKCVDLTPVTDKERDAATGNEYQIEMPMKLNVY